MPFTYDLLPALTIEIELLRFVFLAQMAPHTAVCIIIFGYVVRRKENLQEGREHTEIRLHD